MKQLITLFLLLCCFTITQAQEVVYTVQGVVLDSKSLKPVHNAIITFHPVGDDDNASTQVLAFVTSRQDGTFRVSLSNHKKPVLCRVRLMGYHEQKISITPSNIGDKLTIHLEEKSELLPEVVVVSNSIISKGDTISYKASAFIKPDTYSAEDLIKKLPGLTVDTRGFIHYLGEPIQGVYIEGMDLVADKYQTATRTVKAEDIKSIDVMERFQRVKLLRGLEEGEGAMLNIKLKNTEMLNPSGDVGIEGGLLSKKIVSDAKANALLINSKAQILGSFNIGNTNQIPIQDMAQAQSIPHVSIRNILPQRLPDGTPSRLSRSQKRTSGTFNHLMRLREETTLKYNLAYEYQMQQKSGGQKAKLFNGSDFVEFEDRWDNKNKNHIADLSIDYTQNSSHQYFQNNLHLEGDFLNENNDLDRKNVPIHEYAKIGEFRIADSFNYMKKSDQNLLKIGGLINYRKLPHASIGVPSGTYLYRQILRGQELMAQTGFTYGWGVGNAYNIYGNVNIEGHYQDGNIASTTHDLISEANGGKLLCTTAPTLSYTSFTLKWSLSIPLEFRWDNYCYTDFEKQKKHHRSLGVYPGINANLSYRPNSYWYINFSTRFKHQQTGSFTDYLIGSYHTTFESIITRRNLLTPQTSTIGSTLNVEYRRSIQAFFARLTIAGKRSSGNNIINSILHGTSKEGIVLKGQKIGYDAIGQLYLSKQFRSIKTLVSLLVDYNYLNRPLVISSKHSNLHVHTMSVGTDINSAPAHWLELNASIHYSTNQYKNTYSTNRMDNWLIGSGIILNMGEHLTAKLYNESLISNSNEGAYPTKSIFNGSLSYRQTRYQIDLKCDNLLNEEVSYINKNIEANEYYVYNQLRQRQILLCYTLKL
ncbi:hypothetical protein [Porphyromonas pogonae]|uniref:hypothetical protein n=1 Tax=Porphyromonas pogonae TaxID=867595 RepID=UPI002E75F6ED|nr:hypothetical protein [Porphyromonas pogonae]